MSEKTKSPNFRRVEFECCYNCEHCPSGDCDLYGSFEIDNPYDWICDDYDKYKEEK